MQYDFSVGAGGAQQLDVHGKFFKYKSGLGAIRVRNSKGGYVDLLPGQGVWNLDYDSLTVTDRSGAVNTGVILAGGFDFRDDRITGTVDVVDGGKARTLSNVAFSGYAISGTVGAQYGQVQLWNPVGSPSRLIVSQIICGSSVAGGMQIRGGNVAKATFAGNGRSKNVGGTDSVAEMRWQNSAALVDSFNYAFQYTPAGTLGFIYKVTEPFVLHPGFGLVVLNAQPGNDASATFEYWEDRI